MQKQIGVNNSDMRSQKAASRTISYRRSMCGVRSDVATNWRYFRGCQTSARLISPGSYRKTIAPVGFNGNKVKRLHALARRSNSAFSLRKSTRNEKDGVAPFRWPSNQHGSV